MKSKRKLIILHNQKLKCMLDAITVEFKQFPEKKKQKNNKVDSPGLDFF